MINPIPAETWPVAWLQRLTSAVTFLHSSFLAPRTQLRSSYHMTLRPLYSLKVSSQVTTGMFSHNAWAMIWRSKGSAW